MSTNGTTVYRIMPQTTAPTSRPAIHEPCHRLSVIAPWLVTGSGKPNRVKVSFGEHPARQSSRTASTPPRSALARRRERFGAVPRGRGRARLARPAGESESKEAPSQQRRPVPYLVVDRHRSTVFYSVSWKQYRAP